MKLDRYPYYADADFLDYEFESNGPKGIITKVARFTLIGPNIYSFGFGDLDQTTGDISDTIVSNNGDAAKVLATVASIIHDFTTLSGQATILIRGSTPARTRWYQMNINLYWEEIGSLFEVFGYHHGRWELFTKGCNYEAIMGRRRAAH
jgi:hypothetical protein